MSCFIQSTKQVSMAESAVWHWWRHTRTRTQKQNSGVRQKILNPFNQSKNGTQTNRNQAEVSTERQVKTRSKNRQGSEKTREQTQGKMAKGNQGRGDTEGKEVNGPETRDKIE